MTRLFIGKDITLFSLPLSLFLSLYLRGKKTKSDWCLSSFFFQIVFLNGLFSRLGVDDGFKIECSQELVSPSTRSVVASRLCPRRLQRQQRPRPQQPRKKKWCLRARCGFARSARSSALGLSARQGQRRERHLGKCVQCCEKSSLWGRVCLLSRTSNVEQR